MSKKTRKIRHALFMSVISMMLCCAMLVGTTFAWFTDEVTSAGNIIKSGTLDVTMEWADGTLDPATATWTDASTGAIFKYDLWEPGYTQVCHVRIANVGTLALKYQLYIVANGEVSDLADVIDVYYADPAVQVTGREDVEDMLYIGTLSEVLEDMSATASGELKAADPDLAHTVTLALKMQETAGNEYQDMSIGSDFSVKLVATQLTAEDDSFDNQYDKMATIDTVDELKAALAADYDLITLGADIELTETLEIPADKTVAIDLGGYKISGTDTVDLYSLIHVANGGNLTVMDSVGTGKISYDAGEGKTGTAVWVEGALVLESGIIEITGEWDIGFGVDLRPNAWGTDYARDATFVMNGGAIVASDSGVRVNINSSAAYEDTAVFTMNGGRISAAYDAIFAQHNYAGNAQVIVNNGTVTSSNTHAVRIYGNVSTDIDVTINGGDFTGKLTNFDRGDVSIFGGTFSVDPSDYVVDGYKAVLESDRYEVIEYATVVSTVAELEKALANGDNVVLTDDIVLTKTLMAKKDAVIDLNGNIMTAPSSGVMFQSQSNAAPSMIITSSKDGAVINAGNNAVLLGYGSTEIYNVVINVDTTSSSPFSVYGDLTIGEGTVINVKNLKNSLISNNGKVDIVIDGAEIKVDTFKVNGGAMISLTNGTTLAINNTEVNVGLDTTYTSYFISRANNAAIGANCTINVKDADGAAYGIVYKADANVGDKYAWEKQ